MRLKPADESLKPFSLASQAAQLAMMHRTRAALHGPLAMPPGLSQSCPSQGHALCHAETAACANAICWCHERAQRSGTGPEIRSPEADGKLGAWRKRALNAFQRCQLLQHLRTAVPYFFFCQQILSPSGKQDISTFGCAFKQPFHVWVTRCCAMWGSTRCSAAAMRSACRAPTTMPKSASCKSLDRGMLWPMRSGTCHSFSSAHATCMLRQQHWLASSRCNMSCQPILGYFICATRQGGWSLAHAPTSVATGHAPRPATSKMISSTCLYASQQSARRSSTGVRSNLQQTATRHSPQLTANPNNTVWTQHRCTSCTVFDMLYLSLTCLMPPRPPAPHSPFVSRKFRLLQPPLRGAAASAWLPRLGACPRQALSGAEPRCGLRHHLVPAAKGLPGEAAGKVPGGGLQRGEGWMR